MIQDFSAVFEGKQQIRVNSVSFRQRHMFRKVAGTVLAGALFVGLVSSVTFGMLIKAGHKELESKKAVKLQLIKEQQLLYSQRSDLFKKEAITVAAADLGLFPPKTKQVRRL